MICQICIFSVVPYLFVLCLLLPTLFPKTLETAVRLLQTRRHIPKLNVTSDEPACSYAHTALSSERNSFLSSLTALARPVFSSTNYYAGLCLVQLTTTLTALARFNLSSVLSCGCNPLGPPATLRDQAIEEEMRREMFQCTDPAICKIKSANYLIETDLKTEWEFVVFPDGHNPSPPVYLSSPSP